VRINLRYAYGVFLGFIIPGIIFMGAAAIRLMHFGLPPGDTTVYGPLLIWTLVAFALLFVPLILIRFMRKSFFHEFLMYELGGLALFTPFWVALGAEISGDRWIDLYLDFSDTGGLVDVFPFPSGPTSVDWMDVGAILYIPITIGLILGGLFLLRPSHIQGFKRPTKPSEIKVPKGETAPSSTIPSTPTSESDIPGTKPPPISQSNIDELKGILMKLNTPDAIINAILNAGFASTTDLVATTPEQLANVTGLDKMAAADLQMSVQKILFYGGLT
jgi:hypothetical protein